MSTRPEQPSGPITGTAPATRPSRGGWALRDRPGVVWLVLAFLIALVHPFVPGSQWLLVHLVLLGALTHSAMVWSTHFTQALLKTPTTIDDRAWQNRRIALLLLGATLVFVGVPTGWWPLTVAGATAVSTAVVWHGTQLWRRLRRALPGRFRVTVRYYLAAAACVPIGAGFGVWLARGVDDDLHGRLLVAHSMVMLLGWIGLTVTGTLVTLWPTMLRARLDDRAESLARQALPVLAAGVAVTAAGAALGQRLVALAGVATYAAGLAWWGRALLAPARQAPPRRFATWSVTAALAWGVVIVAWVGWRLASSSDWREVASGYGAVAAVAAVGFGAQLLFGALSHLIPTVLGGGPSVVRACSGELERAGLWRVTVVNVGLTTCLLPVPSTVRVAVSVVVLGALAAFIPLMFRGIRAAVAARRELVAAVGRTTQSDARVTAAAPVARPRGHAQLVAAVGVLAVAASLGVAVAPGEGGLLAGGGLGGQASASIHGSGSVAPTGHTTRVRVEAHDMRYAPSSIDVPYGDRLVIELVNKDRSSPHDLSFGPELTTERVMPGRSATLDVGVVGASAEGWCTIVGHRQMGMVLQVEVQGAPVDDAVTEAGPSIGPSSPDADPPLDLGGDFSAGFRAVDARLPGLPAGTTHRITLPIEEKVLEVAPGRKQRRWTFGGTVPGPTLHGRVGDRFVVTVVNHGSMGHSVDFHAGERAPDAVMRTIPPGESLTYEFTATRAGVWMYHCSTMPMSAHIGAGMHGAVVIEPRGLDRVDHEWVLVQSEVFLDGDGRASVAEVDADAAAADRPTAVAFNGVANQYVAQPLEARVGERVRLWVLAAGPNRGTAFHVVGGQFDTVWAEGAYRLRPDASAGGSQVLDLGAAQGGFVELTLREPGTYPFVTHAMADAERGARGLLRVVR